MRPPRLIQDAEHSNGQIASKAIFESSQNGQQDIYQRPWNQQLVVSSSTKFEHGEGETLTMRFTASRSSQEDLFYD